MFEKLNRCIELFEVSQNNLKGFDLKLPFYNLIVVTGVSGAGKKCNDSTQFVSINENMFAYSPMEHRHAPEIQEKILNIKSFDCKLRQMNLDTSSN